MSYVKTLSQQIVDNTQLGQEIARFTHTLAHHVAQQVLIMTKTTDPDVVHQVNTLFPPTP